MNNHEAIHLLYDLSDAQVPQDCRSALLCRRSRYYIPSALLQLWERAPSEVNDPDDELQSSGQTAGHSCRLVEFSGVESISYLSRMVSKALRTCDCIVLRSGTATLVAACFVRREIRNSEALLTNSMAAIELFIFLSVS
ncbi:hypothetical protein TNCV_2827211 [Trichonephila clavipes]|nr:hypothetical protein TNCV_2827211 [Trichonephila clavipes]